MGKLLDYEEASMRLGVKKSTLYSWVSQRRIPFIRLSGRLVKFDSDALDEWLRAHNVAPVGSSETVHG